MASTINADTSNGVIITPDTSGEIELQANGVTKAKVTANGLQDANGNSLRGGSYRNFIINGDMRIAQRGTSVTGITTTGYQTVDRMRFVNNTAGTWTNTQDTDVPTGQGFANSFKLQCTTADASLASTDALQIQTRLEGQNLQHLKKGTSSAEKVTLSFWVKSNKTGTYIVEARDMDNTRHFPKSYTIDTADTWEKKTITFDGDTTGTLDNDNNVSFDLQWWLGSGTDYTSGTLPSTWESIVDANRAVGQVNLADSTSNYINITGVQLEIGEGASDFENLPYDVSLARCQRYFQWAAGSGNALNTTQGLIGIKFLTEMRANPTATLINGTLALQQYFISSRSITSINNNATNKNGGGIGVVSSGMTANGFLFLTQGNGYISFSAEL